MSSPALQIRPPQIDSPLTTLGQLASIRGAQTENLLRQQQIRQSESLMQEQQAQADQKNRDIADENTLKSALADPTVAAQVGKGDLSYFNGKVSPTNLLKFQNGLSEAHKNAATASVEDLKKNEAHAAQATESLFGLSQLPDEDAIASYPSVRQLLLDQGNELAKHAPATITSKKDLAKVEADLNLTAGINSKALALKGEQAKQAQENAAAASSNANAAFENYKLDRLKGGAVDDTKSAALMDKLFAGKPDLRAQADSIYAAGKAAKPLEPGAGVDAVKAFYDEQIGKPQGAAATTKANIPAKVAEQAALLPGEVKKAVSTAQATEGIDIDKAVKQAKALRMGDNQAVAGVAPSAIQSVQEHAIKLDQAYAGVKDATDAMDRLIALATGGNKAAGANLPLAGVGAVNAINGIKRINSAEIHQYGTAGSLLDEIKGKLGKWTEGKPIPADVLKDIKTLHDDLGAQAYSKYAGELHSLNERTGAQYKPTYEPPTGAEIETRPGPGGATYQRRKGSNDPWVKK